VVPADLVGRAVALRRALDENADDLSLAAAPGSSSNAQAELRRLIT
jgi:hypothetical protein